MKKFGFDPKAWADKRRDAVANAAKLREARSRLKAMSLSGDILTENCKKYVNCSLRSIWFSESQDCSVATSWEWSKAAIREDLDNRSSSVLVVDSGENVESIESNESVSQQSNNSVKVPSALARKLNDRFQKLANRRSQENTVQATCSSSKTLSIHHHNPSSTGMLVTSPTRTLLNKTVSISPMKKCGTSKLKKSSDKKKKIEVNFPRKPSNHKDDDDELVTRQMFDKNTLRIHNREVFIKSIRLWREDEFGPHPPPCMFLPSTISVYVRKRPLFAREIQGKNEFDVVTILEEKNQLTLHNCLFFPDLKRPFINHLTYSAFTRVFGDSSNNEKVYKESCAMKMVDNVVHNVNGLSTLFMFGQTGSGKTYTMNYIESRASEEIFLKKEETTTVSLTFIEIRGRKAFDLLMEENEEEKNIVKLREVHDGSLRAEGAREILAESPTHLITLIRDGHARRCTESTGANAVSSRSHAICMISIGNATSTNQKGGRLMLVDCAGSERRKDSMYHDKERRKEGAEINASLHALKECIRWRGVVDGGGSQIIPFRGSLLTRVLAESFCRKDAMLGVIGTLSPCATDVEHSLSTLRIVNLLTSHSHNSSSSLVHEDKQTELFPKEEKPKILHPNKWSNDEVKAWIDSISLGEVEPVPGTTGQMLVRMTEARFTQMCKGDERKGYRIFKALHDQIRHVEGLRKKGKPHFPGSAPSSGPSTASSVKTTLNADLIQ